MPSLELQIAGVMQVPPAVDAVGISSREEGGLPSPNLGRNLIATLLRSSLIGHNVENQLEGSHIVEQATELVKAMNL